MVVLVAAAVVGGGVGVVVAVVRVVVGAYAGVGAVEDEVEGVAGGQFEGGVVVEVDVVGVLA